MSISTSQTPSGRTPEQDAVICALIGLARATEAKEISAGTAPVLFASLAAAMPGNTLSASAANDLISQIHEQKAIIAPDCAACPSPCGRTADFLPEDLNRTDDDLFEERNRLLQEAQRTGQDGMDTDPCRSGRSGNHKTLYGLRVHGRIRVRK